MKSLHALALLFLSLTISAVAAPPKLSDIVSKRDFKAAATIAAKLVEFAELSIYTDIPPTSEVEQGAKLFGKLIITDKPIVALRLEKCVVFTSAPVETGAYISGSVIVSSQTISSGSYTTGSVVLSNDAVNVGSYSVGNTVQAKAVKVGTYSSGSTYYNVKPDIGKASSEEPSKSSDQFRKWITL